MTTSELLREAGQLLHDAVANTQHETIKNLDLMDKLLQEADRLEGLELVSEIPESAKGITLGQGFGKPKPEKLEAFSGGIVPVEKLDGSFNEWVCTTLHTLTRRENERNGYE